MWIIVAQIALYLGFLTITGEPLMPPAGVNSMLHCMSVPQQPAPATGFRNNEKFRCYSQVAGLSIFEMENRIQRIDTVVHNMHSPKMCQLRMAHHDENRVHYCARPARWVEHRSLSVDQMLSKQAHRASTHSSSRICGVCRKAFAI